MICGKSSSSELVSVFGPQSLNQNPNEKSRVVCLVTLLLSKPRTQELTVAIPQLMMELLAFIVNSKRLIRSSWGSPIFYWSSESANIRSSPKGWHVVTMKVTENHPKSSSGLGRWSSSCECDVFHSWHTLWNPSQSFSAIGKLVWVFGVFSAFRPILFRECIDMDLEQLNMILYSYRGLMTTKSACK